MKIKFTTKFYIYSKLLKLVLIKINSKFFLYITLNNIKINLKLILNSELILNCQIKHTRIRITENDLPNKQHIIREVIYRES